MEEGEEGRWREGRASRKREGGKTARWRVGGEGGRKEEGLEEDREGGWKEREGSEEKCDVWVGGKWRDWG